MSVGYGVADFKKQAQQARNIEFLLAAICVDGSAFHIFHYQEGLALWRVTSINQPRDIGMIQTSKNLPFMAETVQHVRGIHAVRHDFDGHVLAKLVIVAAGEVNGPHAALANFAKNAPSAEPRPGNTLGVK